LENSKPTSAKMSVRLAVVFIVIFTVSVKAGSEGGGPPPITFSIPPEAIDKVIDKIDTMFSCSKYAGYAPCYFGDSGEDKRNRFARECSDGANAWDYKFSSFFGGTCYCYKCK
jgi:hypothetical protein